MNVFTSPKMVSENSAFRISYLQTRLGYLRTTRLPFSLISEHILGVSGEPFFVALKPLCYISERDRSETIKAEALCRRLIGDSPLAVDLA